MTSMRRTSITLALLAAAASGCIAGCGGSSDAGLTEPGIVGSDAGDTDADSAAGSGGSQPDSATDGGGTGGTKPDASEDSGGSGGTAGSGTGGSSTGGTAGSGTGGSSTGGTAGEGGTGTGGTGTGGVGGTGTGGAGGSSTGGAAGDGGTGGTATGGSGGGSPCGVCDDGVACTTDACDGAVCKHTIGPNSGATACPQGMACDPKSGCVQGPICATTAQCQQQLGTDPCKTGIVCNTALALCEYAWLDNDKDGNPPLVCGGADCDDSDGAKAPGKTEVCDGKDNDCNGAIDDGATCAGLMQCVGGACGCPADNTCGGDCIDKLTSNTHCGTCNHPCVGSSTCQNGQCECSPSSTACPSGCVDLVNDPKNCSACGAVCGTGFTCSSSHCVCSKTDCSNECVDMGSDANHCGGCDTKCGASQSCVGGQCVCAGGVPPCNGACVNTSTDPNNCGACGTKCDPGKNCTNSQCLCPAPLSACGAACVNLATDPSHCGVCSTVCPAGNACVNSACQTCAPAELVLLVDGSGSMVAILEGAITRFQAIQNGTKNFIAASASTTIGAGLQFFPINTYVDTAYACNTTVCSTYGYVCNPATNRCATGLNSCSATDFGNLRVGINPLSSAAHRAALGAALDAEGAGGSTPMGVALQGVLARAKTSSQNTGRRAAVVMLTDGIPNDCPTTATIADAVAAVQPYAQGTPKVVTYVVGVGSVGNLDWAPTEWNQVAAAGGTTSFYPANTQAQLEAALATIRSAMAMCQ